MIVRLIAETVTPVVAKSRFLKLSGARAVVSNRPYLEREAPVWHPCQTTLIVKQGAQGFPFYHRAQMGFLHLDFKAHTEKQARRKCKAFFALQCVGHLTTWGYGTIRWLLQKIYPSPEASPPRTPRFRVLKGMPSLSSTESRLVMAALLHDLVDTDLYLSKLGRSLTIPHPQVRWLCVHHHSLKTYPDHPELKLLQEADRRASGYIRLLHIPTPRRQMTPINTEQLAIQLEQAAQRSVYQLYSVIYQS